MGDVVNLKPAALVEDQNFIVDLARFRENLLDEKSIRKKYKLVDDASWQKMGEDDELIRKVEEESVHRIRSGASKREKAQQLVVKAPDVAASIMNRTDANDRHRLDACKVLNEFAANPQENTTAAMDRFVIRIDLSGGGGDHVEVYDKSISINADDTPDDGTGRGLQRPLPASIPDKRWDDSDVVASATMRTGYKQVDHEAATDKRPKRDIPDENIPPSGTRKVERTPWELAVESMMKY